MSTVAEEIKEEVKVSQPKEALLSKRRKGLVTDPLDDDNPVTVQVLGICSALAVTSVVKPTFVMAIALMVVVVLSNVIVSVLRNMIPGRVRIIAQLAIVATLVALVDMVLRAFLPDLSKQLSVFVGLIITNCIVMGRLEAFAMGNKPWDSALDGLGSGLGYAWVILAIAFVRELLGAGSVLGVKIFKVVDGEGTVLFDLYKSIGYVNMGLMSFPVGAFMVVGIIIWIQRTKSGYVEH
jgi:Na+-transporting NADH:ubiquinone oxidoreductase subunit D